MSNFDGSMKGSGIYSQDVEYDEFDCENKNCGEHNDAGITSTDDWGRYTIECEHCGSTFRESSLADDRDEYLGDLDRDDYDQDYPDHPDDN